jgi:hypothetical protein
MSGISGSLLSVASPTILVSAVILWFLFQSNHIRKQVGSSDNQESSGDSDNKSQEQKRRWRMPFIENIKSYLEKRRAYKEHETASDPSTRSMVWATWVIAGSTIVSIWVNIRTYGAIEGQLGAMEAEQRPWIKVEISPGPLDVLIQPTAENGPWINFSPHVKMTNVGKSPAFNAHLVGILGYIVGEGHSDPNAERATSCETSRREKIDNFARGNILFPNDFFTEEVGPGKYVVGFVGDNARKYMKDNNGKLTYVFYIIGSSAFFVGSNGLKL